ncbi:hypothetical protein [Thermus thermophilus]|uniref:Hypothetical conserved protein n=1 Tax=Thermus thermophilus (strain ATCC BAA-163 / DSM 7039 / HB27) TaxID=262724 RepID=Q72JW1_THET2|nr:hypothetical protein [Thermus thermophilus]AAS81005.1 hypothetical conserved protein [Thermus thermophilus HB27]QMV30716.1 hypothetical protein HB27c_C0685 [Thermus thermophilus]WMV96041.1 hypothetical protein RB649_03370 [Thermus thermophilus HB27]
MTFQDLLKRVGEAKPETLPALLPELFKAVYEGGFLDTEVEALFLALKRKTGVSVAALRKDWARYRATRDAQAREEEASPITPEAREAALELSEDPALLHRAIRAIGELGVVGEEENRGLLYLALLSARTEAPISVLVKGRSSSGKSFLVKQTLTLIPPRGYYELSSMSAKALVYADLDFRHRHLVLYEEDGLSSEEVLYLVRTLLSEGQIRYLTVEKTPQGHMAAREIVRPGPTALITTLTKGLTKEDNETRTFSLYMDDTKDHTLRVVQALAEREARGGLPEVDPTPWHALYELLPQKEVVVPYAPAIARLLEAQDLPEDLTRLRRDFGRFLTLVKVVALLHHARREEREGRLVATLEDYALAYHLAARPMARSVHTVSPQALTLAVAVREVYEAKMEEAAGKNIPEGSVAVYVKDLARHLRWAKRTVQKWVDQAEAAGLVDVQKDGNRLAIRPVEGAPLEEAAFRLLPEPERLARELGEGGSYVHPLTGETCVLLLPQTACAFPAKAGENAVLNEENQRARHAHDRARPPEERPSGEEKPRARSEVASPSQNSEECARAELEALAKKAGGRLFKVVPSRAPALEEDEVEVEL